MSIKDDGIGIPSFVKTDGMGLKIMNYRAGIIGASLDTRADTGGGTVVMCIFNDSSFGKNNYNNSEVWEH